MSASLLPPDQIPPEQFETIWRLLPLLAGVDPCGEPIAKVLRLMNAHLAQLGQPMRLAPLPDLDLERVVPRECFSMNLFVARTSGAMVLGIDMRGSPHYLPELVATLEPIAH